MNAGAFPRLIRLPPEEIPVRWPRRFLTLLAVPALLAGLVPGAALASSGPSPSAGVHDYNTKVCGRDWLSIHIPETSYFNVYNDVFGKGATGCVTAEHYHADFAVSETSGSGFHAYPNISSGWESGRYTCTGHHGACYTYPVQVSRDGDPVTSVRMWLAAGRYDAGYDIWTNPTDAHPLQDTGTEVMIWLAHPGIGEGVVRTVMIDGIRWDVTTWITHHPGLPSWRLLIYYAVRQRSSVSGLHLNDFFREAERHGEMSASYWLTGIDAGFELVAGGLHNNIHEYSLTGPPATAGGRS